MKPKSIQIPAASDLAEVFPYSRLVRKGGLIEVSGTGAYDGDQLVAPGDMYRQVVFIYQKIGHVLEEAGAGLADIIKITVFLTDATRWPEVARAHRRFFNEIRPAVTLVEVSALIDPEMEVEIEASAYLEN